MKTLCRVLGVARSHVHELHHRHQDWRDGRKGRSPRGDAQLLAEIREHIAELPSYGYRRACAQVNRQRSSEGGARVNSKRAYRVMAQANLLLPKAPRRRQSSRVHDGQVPAAFEHFNEVHPHSSLKMRSPREFRRHQAAQVRSESITDLALNCE